MQIIYVRNRTLASKYVDRCGDDRKDHEVEEVARTEQALIGSVSYCVIYNY
jgi:hypothetical protein